MIHREDNSMNLRLLQVVFACANGRIRNLCASVPKGYGRCSRILLDYAKGCAAERYMLF